ncbi:isopentenyl phosphate kinase [Candidatus Dependentiae bacterium]
MIKKFTRIITFLFLCGICMFSKPMKFFKNSKKILKIMKIGGSIITDKSSDIATAREDIIDRIAQEISLHDNQNNQIILTHGTGSFGHPLFEKYNLDEEFNYIGTMEVYQSEKALNDILIKTLRMHGIKAVSIDPMYNIICEDGRIKCMNIDLIQKLMKEGFIPVIFGTMVRDTKRKAYGLSSDQITTYLAEKLDVSGVGFGSSENGVYDGKGNVITEINPIIFDEFKKYIGDSEHTDVTGGMSAKVKKALGASASGLTSFIFNAKQEGNISRFLQGEEIGTKISS